MNSKNMKNLVLSLAIGLLFIAFVSCDNNEDKDWAETVQLTVASEIADFYPFENIGVPSDGITDSCFSEKLIIRSPYINKK
jgi:hypothetical protein